MTILAGPTAHPLFSRCPALRDHLAHLPLGTFPTPVQRLDDLAAHLGIGELWVKRDDLCCERYGGNKTRKLEFLLADALRVGAREVVTLGAAGSNHALATAIHAGRLRMPVTLFLYPQPPSGHVRRNLLLDHAFGADLRAAADADDALAQAEAYVAARAAETGVAPYLIPFGGTSTITAAGMIDAGLELAMQVHQGQCTVPDVAYVALGSMGTACGVALGLAAGGCPTRVRAVRVVDGPGATQASLDALIEETRDAMCAFDSACDCTVSMMLNVRVIDGYVGPGYGLADERTLEAMRVAADAGLVLDETYTAKAFAALLADAASGTLSDLSVVFWCTFDSHDFNAELADADPAALPPEFAVYFENS